MAVAESKLGKSPAPADAQPSDHWIGECKELGKTEVRQAFLHLVDELQEEDFTVAITDRGEQVAVMMSMKFYRNLVAILKPNSKPGENPFVGTFKKVEDLEKSNEKVNSIFKQAIKKSASSI